jgi:hypothetical protein
MAILPVGFAAEEGGYQIERSLRFNSADSAYLNRTPGSAGNRRTWTLSFWHKRSKISESAITPILGTPSNTDLISFDTDDVLRVWFGTNTYNIETTQVFRDVSAWGHWVISVDTTQGTSSNRVKIYYNGFEITAFSTASYPTQNYDTGVNNTVEHRIGRMPSGDYNYLNGYLAEMHLIDGQALTPSSFGETDTDTGVWKPKAYSGSYGTNGFYLDFADNSSTTALGYDAAGSNDWTPNNFSVTAGAGNDSLVDSPTRYGTDTGVGGEVRGNYATLNPLDKNAAVTTVNGNLSYTSSNDRIVKATIGVTTGKWYWEFAPGGGGSTSGCGVINPSVNIHATVNLNIATAGVSYLGNGNKSVNGTASSYGATYTSGDIIGVALNLDSNSVTFYKNNTSQGSISLTSGLEWFPAFDQNTGTNFVNFGQRPFAYTAPSGFKALCTTNLPEPTVADGGEYFNAVLWTGNSTNNRQITGVGFAPEFVMTKARSAAYTGSVQDIVRGTGADKQLHTSTTEAENSTGNNVYGYISSFNADGYTLTAGTDPGNPYAVNNESGVTYVAWNWKANGSGVSNTDGTITSTVSANTTAGFSIVTYTGNGTSGATVGHGLNSPIKMLICKQRNGGTYGWNSWHTGLSADYYIALNSTGGQDNSVFIWDTSGMTSTVFTHGSDTIYMNNSDSTYVAYCFAPIAGYSAFGSYTGNNSSTDGTFVYLGFRPRFIMIKSTASDTEWVMVDTSSLRGPYNLVDTSLYANRAYSESTIGTVNDIDILSNGFKLRNNTGYVNASQTYIYAAFAENPFKYSLAR